MMQTLNVGTYNIYIGQDFCDPTFLQAILPNNKRLAIITDSNLKYGRALQHQLMQEGIDTAYLSFPAVEKNKNRATKHELEDTLFEQKFGRDTCLLAIGGGIVTDMAGFVAATYCRGVPVVYIPTTLLAMIDASIGGKNGVNTSLGKNLIGTVTMPHAVIIDINVLATLPVRQWRNGMAEIIKHSVIADGALFKTLQHYARNNITPEQNTLIDLIHQNCLIKNNIVAQDKHDHNIRQLLNFGHTIGHAIETLEDYRLSHGEAVAIGMLVECYLSIEVGVLKSDLLLQVADLMRTFGLPLKTQAFRDKHKFLETLSVDKKSIQAIPRFILLTDIGLPYYTDGNYTHTVLPEQLDAALTWAQEYF